MHYRFVIQILLFVYRFPDIKYPTINYVNKNWVISKKRMRITQYHTIWKLIWYLEARDICNEVINRKMLFQFIRKRILNELYKAIRKLLNLFNYRFCKTKARNLSNEKACFWNLWLFYVLCFSRAMKVTKEVVCHILLVILKFCWVLIY